MTGRTYRACGCRDPLSKKVIGATCERLKTDGKHGTWYYAVSLPKANGASKKLRKGGYKSEREAKKALRDVTDKIETGVRVDGKETVEQWLTSWHKSRRNDLAPRTWYQYGHHITKTLVPSIGSFALEDLRHDHISDMVDKLEVDGRGPTVIAAVVAVLRSSLSDAVSRRRLRFNPAEHVATPKVRREERQVWTADQAVQFLGLVAGAPPWQVDPLAGLFEVMIGTGLRRGEVLGLRWSDVDLERNVLQVRQALVYVGGKLTFGAPKTKGSAAGVGLSGRVVTALEQQRKRQAADRAKWTTAWSDTGLVFTRENGEPIRPEYLLREFHKLSELAGVPTVRLHDLRHLAATLMIASGAPLAVVSKTLRHSQIGITADLYGHLTAETAHAAAQGLETVLAQASQSRDRNRLGTTSGQHHP